MGLLQQDEKTVAAQRSPGKVEGVLNHSGIPTGIAFDGHQVSPRRKDEIGRPTQFDVFVGSVGAGGIEEDFVDHQFCVGGECGKANDRDAQTNGVPPFYELTYLKNRDVVVGTHGCVTLVHR